MPTPVSTGVAFELASLCMVVFYLSFSAPRKQSGGPDQRCARFLPLGSGDATGRAAGACAASGAGVASGCGVGSGFGRGVRIHGLLRGGGGDVENAGECDGGEAQRTEHERWNPSRGIIGGKKERKSKGKWEKSFVR